MRIALVGYSGYWGRKLARVVGALGHQVVAWIDRTNSEQLLMSSADAAIIATPPDTHFHLSMTALERGMDVLVEKPMTMRRTHAALLTETAHDHGLVLGVDSTFCHTKAFAYLAALDEPVISYQSIRLAPEMPQAVIPAGWDIVVHDLSILDGLGIRWEGVGLGGMEDGSVASASFLLPSGGSAFILASRCWPTKERAITIHMPSGTYYWTLKALFKVKGDLFDVILSEDTEPLVNLITEFTKRCRTRELSGTTDGEHGLRVVGALERLSVTQRWVGTNNVTVGKDCLIMQPSNLYDCRLGNHVKVGPFCEIQNDVVIGDDTVISSHTFIAAGTRIGNNVFVGHHVTTCNDRNPEAYNPRWVCEPPVIGNNASIGSGAIILSGVTIADDSIIGAGALVTKNWSVMNQERYGYCIGTW